MNKRLVLVRHNHNPPDDRVASWAYLNGFEIDQRFAFAGGELPENSEVDSGEFSGVVFYGGPFNASETKENEFLVEEYRLMDAFMKAGLPVLGLCQGAQQIAHHLGAWAGAPAELLYEFGYYKLVPSKAAIEEQFMTSPIWAAQVHHHTFDLPGDAIHLASSDAYENQAFRVGTNVYGLEFHPEQTIECFRRWQRAPWAPYGKPGSQTREEQNRLMALHDEDQADWFYGFLDNLFGSAGDPN